MDRRKGFCWYRPLFISAIVVVAVFSTVFVRNADAQDAQDVPDVHLTPRAIPAPPDKHGEYAPDPHVKLFKSGVDLVLVPVTVLDPMDRLVTGLDKSNFTVFQDNKQQPVRNLSNDDAPISVGVILDESGSMTDKIDNARNAVRQFLSTSNPQDEFFLITFSDSPRLSCGFTHNINDIVNRLLFTRPGGETALLDAIYLGVDEMRHATNTRKALLIISDGGDNHSRYTESEVKSTVEESDMQVFSIGLFDQAPATPEERLGPELLDELTSATGGQSFTVSDPNDLADVASKIGLALRDEYVLAYQPTIKPRDGKWHKIRIKLQVPRGLPHLHVSSRTGFYAPSQ